MTLRHLKIFVAVCDYKTITKASEALYIAQPSVCLLYTSPLLCPLEFL